MHQGGLLLLSLQCGDCFVLLNGWCWKEYNLTCKYIKSHFDLFPSVSRLIFHGLHRRESHEDYVLLLRFLLYCCLHISCTLQSIETSKFHTRALGKFESNVQTHQITLRILSVKFRRRQRIFIKNFRTFEENLTDAKFRLFSSKFVYFRLHYLWVILYMSAGGVNRKEKVIDL